MDCIGIYIQQTVDQLGEKSRSLGWREHLDRRVLPYARPASTVALKRAAAASISDRR